MTSFSPSILILFLMFATACGHTMGQRGHDLADNPQTRSAFDLMLVRDCELAAYSSGDQETLRSYLQSEIQAMEAYRDTGAVILVRPFPIEVEIAAAYARLAMLAEEKGHEEEAAQLRERALVEAEHDHDGIHLNDWDGLVSLVEEVDEHRQAAIDSRNGILAVPLHCAEDDWVAEPAAP